MQNISLAEFKNTEEYQKFIQENPSVGSLKVQVFTADQAIPLPNTQIFITKEIGNYNVIFFEGITNSSGVIDNIVLPAPDGGYNIEKYELPTYTNYKLVARNNLYNAIKEYTISMFGNTKVLQYIKIAPNILGGIN